MFQTDYNSYTKVLNAIIGILNNLFCINNITVTKTKFSITILIIRTFLEY